LLPPDQSQSYPPYNIERTGETTYRITMAVAGFDETEISIEAREHALTVKGEKAEDNVRRHGVPVSRDCQARFRTPLPTCRAC
jgi:HSP20 family molecular chaperone IbpA